MITLNDIKFVSFNGECCRYFPVSLSVEIILHPMLLLIKLVSLNDVLSLTVKNCRPLMQ